jgi:hypothetical protein
MASPTPSGSLIPAVPAAGPDQRWFNTLQATVNAAFSDNRPTTQRPSSPVIGQHTFDTTLNIPIWCKSLNPVVWVNASGTAV